MNRVWLIGRLGRDVEIRTLQSGGQVATLSVAETQKWKDKAGNEREHTNWVRVISWIKSDKQADFYGKALRKGRQVAVDGRLRYREWDDKSGGKRSALEVEANPNMGIVPLAAPPKRDGGQQQEQKQEDKKQEYDDEIPF